MKLNLGSGDDVKDGYVNVDCFNKKANIVHDLDKFPYPFNDNMFDAVLAYNILEHLQDPYRVLLEIHRISLPGAIVKIVTPHFSSGNCWGDVQHRHGFGAVAFRHKNLEQFFKLKDQKIIFSKWLFPISWLANKFPGLYDYHLAYIFRANDLFVEFEVKK